jgi:hopanoid biosynthesis associated protein HpnK
MTRRLIVTADDFGLSLEVNEAVEQAHREGILTCASLVVAGAAAADAIRRARGMPKLGVGLHLALYDAPAMAPGISRIAPDGKTLGRSAVSTGAAIMLLPKVRAAARREIAAQFDEYRKTGLPLGHLDGHWHCQQHPAVLAMALELGKPLGLRAVRIPFEPYGFSRRVAGGGLSPGRLAHVFGHFPLALFMRRQVAAAGLAANDRFFGKNDQGAVTEELLTQLVERLPEGVTEVGLHPAVRMPCGPHGLPLDWQPERELAALTSPALRRAVDAKGVELCRWADIA